MDAEWIKASWLAAGRWEELATPVRGLQGTETLASVDPMKAMDDVSHGTSLAN